MIAYDKKLHISVGAVISFFSCFIFPILIALGICTLAGIGKEVYDKVSKKGTVEFLDFVATELGGIAGIGLYMFLFH